jgi:predicted aconitase with swiveling domain
MPSGRGSSSSSSVLAECIRGGTAPAALLLYEPDPILVVGAIVARELYGRTIPVALCEPGSVPDAAMATLEGSRLTIGP